MDQDWIETLGTQPNNGQATVQLGNSLNVHESWEPTYKCIYSQNWLDFSMQCSVLRDWKCTLTGKCTFLLIGEFLKCLSMLVGLALL